MHGRPASDVGVAGLLAQAFESNISHEQREGECAQRYMQRLMLSCVYVALFRLLSQ